MAAKQNKIKAKSAESGYAEMPLREIMEGLLAGCVLDKFQKRYPSMRIDKLSDKEFDAKTEDFWIEFGNRLHIYQAGFKDGMKMVNELLRMQEGEINDKGN